MEKLEIKDYQEYIDKEDWKYIRDIIFECVIEMANQLLDIKGIDIYEYEDYESRFIKLDKNASKDEVYKKMENLFENEIFTCSDISYLIRWLYFKYNDLEEEGICEYIVKSWFRNYNNIVDEFNEYLEYKEYVEKNDYQKLIKEYNDKCINLFKEMLDYKKKPYNKDDKFNQLYDKVELYYAYYIHTLYDLRLAFVDRARNLMNYELPDKKLDNTESYMIILGNFNTLKETYKENAFIYRDFDLEEGETISDLYMKQIKKFNTLYKEMLDYIHVPYDNDATPHSIEVKTLEYYPYYKETIEEAKKSNYSFDPDIAKLSRMEDVYDRIKSSYKNREEDIKNYIPPKKQEEVDDDMDFIDEWDDEIE